MARLSIDVDPDSVTPEDAGGEGLMYLFNCNICKQHATSWEMAHAKPRNNASYTSTRSMPPALASAT